MRDLLSLLYFYVYVCENTQLFVHPSLLRAWEHVFLVFDFLLMFAFLHMGCWCWCSRGTWWNLIVDLHALYSFYHSTFFWVDLHQNWHPMENAILSLFLRLFGWCTIIRRQSMTIPSIFPNRFGEMRWCVIHVHFTARSYNHIMSQFWCCCHSTSLVTIKLDSECSLINSSSPSSWWYRGHAVQSFSIHCDSMIVGHDYIGRPQSLTPVYPIGFPHQRNRFASFVFVLVSLTWTISVVSLSSLRVDSTSNLEHCEWNWMSTCTVCVWMSMSCVELKEMNEKMKTI